MALTYPFAVNDDLGLFNSSSPITSYQFTVDLKNLPANSHIYWISNGYFNDTANDAWYTGFQTGGVLANAYNSSAANGGMINFSGWNATSATAGAGSMTRQFTWEGVGEEVTHAQDLTSGMSFTINVALTNGQLVETVTDSTGHSFVTGSITAPGGATSLSGSLALATEYFEGPANSYADVSEYNFMVNGQSATMSVQPTILHDAEASTATNYVEAYSTSYYETVSGQNPSGDMYTLDMTGLTIDSDGAASDTLQLAKGFTDLTSDAISVPTLDMQHLAARMTLAQFQSFSTIENGGSITLTTGGAVAMNAQVDSYTLMAPTVITLTATSDQGPTLIYCTSAVGAETININRANLATGSVIDGNGGITVVDFTGKAGNYTITDSANGSVTVVDNVAGQDGSVNLVNVIQMHFSDLTMTIAHTNSVNEEVSLLYQGALGRTPDVAGLAGWVSTANALPAVTQTLGVYGLSDASGNYNGTLSIAGGFTNSAEFEAKYGSLTNAQYVTQLYANVLDRAPDASGFSQWEAALSNGESREHVLVGFAESAEAISNATNGFVGQSGAHPAWLLLI